MKVPLMDSFAQMSEGMRPFFFFFNYDEPN